MASDPKPAPKKLLARCGERVVFAKLSSAYEGKFMFGPGSVPSDELCDDSFQHGSAGRRPAKAVTAMALHPAGLVVVPKAGPWVGMKVVIPSSAIVFSLVAEEEG